LTATLSFTSRSSGLISRQAGWESPPAEVARSGITPDYGQLADDGWLWLSDGRIRAVPEGAGHLDQMVLTVQDEGNGCVRLDFRCECCGSTEAPLLVGKRFQPKPTPPNDDPYGSAKLLAKLRERT